MSEALLKSVHQWVNWHEEPNVAGKKPKKVPCDPSGARIDHLNPSNWISYDEAKARMSAVPGLYIGFVLTDHDPFFCIDLDDVYAPENAYVVSDILNRFPGALVEVSHSKTGYHIWGCYDMSVMGGWSRRVGKIEYYSKERFIAVTEQWSGQIYDWQSTALLPFIEEYNLFPRVTGESCPAPEDGPIPGYKGTDDDAKLLQAMARRKDLATRFGRGSTKTTLKQLIRGEIDPADKLDSEHVGAFLCHLAWYTGYDKGRMVRMFEASGLPGATAQWAVDGEKWQRVKWGEIDRACDHVYASTQSRGEPPCYEYYGEVKPVDLSEVDTGEYELVPLDGTRYYSIEDMVDLFKNCVYVVRADRIYKDGELLRQSQFNNAFPGATYTIDDRRRKTTTNAWDAFLHNQHVQFPRVTGFGYDPSIAPGRIFTRDGEQMVNMYCGRGVQPEPGDLTPFFKHIETLLPAKHDQDILLDYLANLVQNEGTKMAWTVVLQGGEGCGKSQIGAWMASIIGRRNTADITPRTLKKQFNGWMSTRSLAIVHEMYTDESLAFAAQLRTLITESYGEVESKGVDADFMRVCVNFLMLTNYKKAVQKTARDRRYSVLYSQIQTLEDCAIFGLNKEYFDGLNAWADSGGVAAIAHYLQTRKVTYGVYCNAPRTTSTDEAIAESRTSTQSTLIEALESGHQAFKHGAVITTQAARELLQAEGHNLAPKSVGQVLSECGFAPSPAVDVMPGGRLKIGGKMERVYILKGSPYINASVDQIRSMYSGGPMAVPPGAVY